MEFVMKKKAQIALEIDAVTNQMLLQFAPDVRTRANARLFFGRSQNPFDSFKTQLRDLIEMQREGVPDIPEEEFAQTVQRTIRKRLDAISDIGGGGT
jgi:hypothetical protein